MTTPRFFVPNPVKPEYQEEAYAEFARMAGVGVPARRIYSITFVHDGERWTATIGERLHGTRTTRRRGKKPEKTTELSDSATVLAIFPGVPYMVVTSQGLTTTASYWENPFMAGQPKSVTYFPE